MPTIPPNEREAIDCDLTGNIAVFPARTIEFGCHPTYVIRNITPVRPPGHCAVHTTLEFQNGGVATHGVNGITNESLLVVVLHRLECLQKGEFPCEENLEAIELLTDALDALNRRTKDRLRRKVEGQQKP